MSQGDITHSGPKDLIATLTSLASVCRARNPEDPPAEARVDPRFLDSVAHWLDTAASALANERVLADAETQQAISWRQAAWDADARLSVARDALRRITEYYPRSAADVEDYAYTLKSMAERALAELEDPDGK